MSERERNDPRKGRQARLGAALRENLKRRKVQARGRAGTDEPIASAASGRNSGKGVSSR